MIPSGQQPVPDARAWFAPPPAIRKVRRAMGVATFNGVTMGLCAAISLAIGLFDLESLLVGVLLVGLTVGELWGRSMLGRLDLRAPRRLAINQLVLGALAMVYFAWKAYSATGNLAISPELQHTGVAEVDEMVSEMATSMKPLLVGAYIGIGVLTAAFCVLNAWYYASRRAWVEMALTLRPPGTVPQSTRPANAAA